MNHEDWYIHNVGGWAWNGNISFRVFALEPPIAPEHEREWSEAWRTSRQAHWAQKEADFATCPYQVIVQVAGDTHTLTGYEAKCFLQTCGWWQTYGAA